MNDETLGHKIKTLRKAKCLSQEKFAEKAELSQQHISRIEKGLTYPGVATLTKIAKALSIPLDDLVETGIKDREDRYTFDILRKLEFLGIEDKLKVSGYIERILDENGIQCIKNK